MVVMQNQRASGRGRSWGGSGGVGDVVGGGLGRNEEEGRNRSADAAVYAGRPLKGLLETDDRLGSDCLAVRCVVCREVLAWLFCK